MALRISLLSLVLACVGVVAFAQPDGGELMNQCTEACQSNSRVPVARRDRCPAFCECTIRDGESLIKANPRIHQDYIAGTETEDVLRLKAVILGCLPRIFGQ